MYKAITLVTNLKSVTGNWPLTFIAMIEQWQCRASTCNFKATWSVRHHIVPL